MVWADISIKLEHIFYFLFGCLVVFAVVYVYQIEKAKKKLKSSEQTVKEQMKPQKKVKKIKEEIKDTEIKPYSLVKTKSKFSFGYWKDWFMDRYFPANTVLVNMELTNGFHRSFIVREKEGGFTFRKKKYLFDDENKYYNMDAKIYAFDYHENITLPLKRVFPVSLIKKSIESSKGVDIEYAINPSTLQRFMTSKIAEGIMKGTQLDEFFRKLQLFLIVTMVAVLIHFVLFIYASGMLQNLKIPFVS